MSLKPFSSANPDLSVKLDVIFPVTYPKTTPRLHVDFGDAVRAQPKRRVHDAIRLTPSKLVGTEIVFAIATEIQDALEDASHELLKEIPNLDQERAFHDPSTQQPNDLADKEIQERESITNLECLYITREQIVELESRQADQVHLPDMALEHTKQKRSDEMDAGYIDFNKSTYTAGLESLQGELVSFKRVFHRVPFSQGPTTKVFTVLPEGSLGVPSNFFILKECMVKLRTSNTARDHEPAGTQQESQRRAVQRLEDSLNQLMHAERNENIANVLNFRIQPILSDEPGMIHGWNINILVERATYGSLHDFMVTTRALELKIAKPWILDIAAGIQWLHQHGLVHGRLHPRNVLMMWQPGRPMKIKLCDVLFQNYLHKLNAKSPSNYNMARSTFWIASETLNSQDVESQRHTDIWDFGILMLQMLFGLDVQKDYESPDALIDAMDLSEPFQNLLSQIFLADHKKRLDAFGITLHQFFVAENPVHAPQIRAQFHPRTTSSSLQPFHDRYHSNEIDFGQSRYAQDFEQEMKLGKGGFGAVYMARNRLENRIYAIKKITQSSASALEPILKEVRFLSQLNHPNVVRYFTAWTEGKFSGSKDVTVFSESSDDGSDSQSMSSSQKHDTSGLDYISSSGRADIEFTYNDEDETVDATSSAQASVLFGYDDEADEANEPVFGGSSHITAEEHASHAISHASEDSASTVPLRRLRRTSTAQAAGKTTLYIQMEYCKNKVC